MTKHFYTTILSILFVSNIFAQGFYDLDTIQTIEITFEESNWDALLDAQKAGDEDYIMAKSVAINGAVFDSVGVKYKGNSTYDSRQVKNPFHIELDTYKDQEYDGYTDIKLSNVANDPSFLREVLSYRIIRRYMDAPLSNYANVYVNGTLLGLFSNSEAISKKFVNNRFGSKKNAFIKCNPIDGAGPNTSDYPNLVYLGQDSADYMASYEMKSDKGWQDLINLMDTLANHEDNIDDILDVNRTLWMLALDNVMVNLDSYIGAFSQNYYLYRQNNGRFAPVVWDLNESFGRFAQTGTTNLNNTTSKQQMSYLLHSTESSFPLVKQLLSNNTYKRMYMAHYKTILLENFDNNLYYTYGLEMQNTIDAAVRADNNKFFTYDNFVDNLTSDITTRSGRQVTSTVGITSLMDGRSSYILGLEAFNKTEPSISNISFSTENPVINESMFVTASIANASTAYLGYRTDDEDIFEYLTMYDDGAHSDGVAGDGVFGVELMVADMDNEYYIYAENADAGMFSPRRAEHEFYTFTATYSVIQEASDIVINELLASNDFVLSDQDGEYDDWIEIYNNTNESIDLAGYALTDDGSDLQQYVFPEGVVIQANSYLLIWADKDLLQTGLHANFKLSSSGETVLLSNASGEVIDEVSYNDQTTDISYGRYANGTGIFQVLNPTPSETNELYTSISDVEISNTNLSAWPNPVSSVLYVDLEGSVLSNEPVMVYNLAGSVVKQIKAQPSLTIDVSDWKSGVYVLSYNSKKIKIAVQ